MVNNSSPGAGSSSQKTNLDSVGVAAAVRLA